MPYSVAEFAQEIKRKYPAYQTWDDAYLVSEVVRKFPVYHSWVDTTELAQSGSKPTLQEEAETEQPGFFKRTLDMVGSALGLAKQEIVEKAKQSETVTPASRPSLTPEQIKLITTPGPGSLAGVGVEAPEVPVREGEELVKGVASAMPQIIAGPARAVEALIRPPEKTITPPQRAGLELITRYNVPADVLGEDGKLNMTALREHGKAYGHEFTTKEAAQILSAFEQQRKTIKPQGAVETTQKLMANVAAAIAEQAEDAAKFYEVPDPSFIYNLGNAIGSAATFFIPGFAVQATTARIATITPRLAVWFGVSVSSILEAATEAGTTYKQVLDQGKSEAEAKEAAGKSFAWNMGVLLATNKLGGLFDRLSGPAKRTLTAMLLEGKQEALQEIIGNVAAKDATLQEVVQSIAKEGVKSEYLKGSGQAGLLGGMVGGGVALGQVAVEGRTEKPLEARQAPGGTEGGPAGQTPTAGQQAQAEGQVTAGKRGPVQQPVRGIDPLYGIPNRAAFDEDLDLAIRNNEQVAVALFDTVNQKRLNDVFGHEMTDAILRDIGQIEAKYTAAMQQKYPGLNRYRTGGDERGIIAPGVDKGTLAAELEPMRQEIEQYVANKVVTTRDGTEVRLSELTHARHLKLPTGAGAITYGTADKMDIVAGSKSPATDMLQIADRDMARAGRNRSKSIAEKEWVEKGRRFVYNKPEQRFETEASLIGELLEEHPEWSTLSVEEAVDKARAQLREETRYERMGESGEEGNRRGAVGVGISRQVRGDRQGTEGGQRAEGQRAAGGTPSQSIAGQAVQEGPGGSNAHPTQVRPYEIALAQLSKMSRDELAALSEQTDEEWKSRPEEPEAQPEGEPGEAPAWTPERREEASRTFALDIRNIIRRHVAGSRALEKLWSDYMNQRLLPPAIEADIRRYLDDKNDLALKSGEQIAPPDLVDPDGTLNADALRTFIGDTQEIADAKIDEFKQKMAEGKKHAAKQRQLLKDALEKQKAKQEQVANPKTGDLFEGTEYEDTRSETQKAIDREKQRREEATKATPDRGFADTPMSLESQDMGEQGSIFERREASKPKTIQEISDELTADYEEAKRQEREAEQRGAISLERATERRGGGDTAVQSVLDAGREGPGFLNTIRNAVTDFSDGLRDIVSFRGRAQPMRQFIDDFRTELVPMRRRTVEQLMQWRYAILNNVYRNSGKKGIQFVTDILVTRDLLERKLEGQEVAGELTEKQLRDHLKWLEETSTPGEKEAAKKLQSVLAALGADMVARGKMQAGRRNYFPHQVIDYTPEWMRGLRFPMRTKAMEPYRAYTKRAIGSKRLIATDDDVVWTHIAKVLLDNAQGDWARGQLQKYDKMAEWAAQNEGKSLRSGQVVTVGGEKYIAYEWQKNYYRVTTISEKAMDKALAAGSSLFPPTVGEWLSGTGIQGEKKPGLGEALAVGKPTLYLVPQKVAYEMSNMIERGGDFWNAVYAVGRMTQKWKAMTLITAGLPYQVGNLVGDIVNLLAFDPRASLYCDHAMRIARKMFYPESNKGLELTPFEEYILQVAKKKDVIGSGLTSELRRATSVGKQLGEAWQRANEFRESVARLCILAHQLDRVQNGKPVQRLANINLDGLDNESAAGKLAREVLVDYQSVPRFYTLFFSRGIMPFIRFHEANGRNHVRTVFGGGTPAIKYLAPIVSAYAAAWAWNNLGDEDRRNRELALPKYVRERFHIIYGRDKEGNTLVWAPQQPIDMAWSWLGLDALGRIASDLNAKRITPRAAARELLSRMGNGWRENASSLLHPIIQFFTACATNEDPFTHRKVMPDDVFAVFRDDWTTPLAREYVIGLLAEKIITPIAQYSNTLKRDDPLTHPVLDWLKASPLNIRRAVGLYEYDPDKESLTETYDGTADEKAIYAYWKARFTREIAKRGLVPGTIENIIDDAERAGNENIRSQVAEWLSSPQVLRAWVGYELRHTTDENKRKNLLQIKRILTRERIMSTEEKVPITARPFAHYRRMVETIYKEYKND